MAINIIVSETRELVNENYDVQMEVTSSSGIDKNVFVKRESTQEYDRVASVDDMGGLTITPDPLAGYYRDYQFVATFKDVTNAKDFAEGVRTRLDVLVRNYDVAQNQFVGSEDHTYTS